MTSASRSSQMLVQVQSTPVGVLDRNRSGLVTFRPDSGWLDGGQRPRLGLGMLQSPGPRTAGTGLPAWFENLLPEDGSALRRRLCAHLQLRPNDSPALLRHLGDDLPGAVRVHGDLDVAQAPEDSTPAADRLRFSLAGMQLKFSMVQADGRFALPSRGTTGHWIVKLPGQSLPELSEVEHATMAWAGAFGLDVPEHHVIELEQLDGLPDDLALPAHRAFAVRRFDRSESGERAHQEDFAQALELMPGDKYAERGSAQVTCASLARLVQDACRSDALDDFLRRLAFVLASGNGDAHLKNWTFQWFEDGLATLSPCYDQVATIAWSPFGWSARRSPRLALAFGTTRHFDRIDRAQLQRFADRAGLSAQTQNRFLDHLADALDAWPQVEPDAPARMQEAIATHRNRVPLIRDILQKRP